MTIHEIVIESAKEVMNDPKYSEYSFINKPQYFTSNKVVNHQYIKKQEEKPDLKKYHCGFCRKGKLAKFFYDDKGKWLRSTVYKAVCFDCYKKYTLLY